MNFEGKVAVITGSSAGIGAEAAKKITSMGGRVTVNYSKNKEGAEEVAHECSRLGETPLIVKADIATDEGCKHLIDSAFSEFNAINILINNAAFVGDNKLDGWNVSFENQSLETWRRAFEVNLTAIFHLSQKLSALLKLSKNASIINIASMSGSIVNRGLKQVHYNSSKAGVIHLTKSLAMEWISYGIIVNSISPGYTKTPMNLRPEMVDQVKLFESGTPMNRMADPDEIVGPAIFLATEASSFCTGIDLVVDGGFTCW